MLAAHKTWPPKSVATKYMIPVRGASIYVLVFYGLEHAEALGILCIISKTLEGGACHMLNTEIQLAN